MTHDRMTLASLAFVLSAALPIGCASKSTSVGSSGSTATSQPTVTATAAPAPPPPPKKAIGDPCVPSDGWTPPPSPPNITVTLHDGGLPDYHLEPIPPESQWSFNDLPLGTPICWFGMNGEPYFTVTCKVDTDCPDGSVCGANQANGEVGTCVKVCLSDRDCPPCAGRGGCYKDFSPRGGICYCMQSTLP